MKFSATVTVETEDGKRREFFGVTDIWAHNAEAASLLYLAQCEAMIRDGLLALGKERVMKQAKGRSK